MFAHKLIAVVIAAVCGCEAVYVPKYYGGEATSYAEVERGDVQAPVYEVPAVPIYGTVPKYGYGYEGAYPKYGYGQEAEGEHYAYPKYHYNYGVHDPHTGDHKSQEETRDGDVVKGSYSLVEPDGTIRTVHYTADDHNGFNAVVSKEGHAIHPVPLVSEKIYAQPKVYVEPHYGHYGPY